MAVVDLDRLRGALRELPLGAGLAERKGDGSAEGRLQVEEIEAGIDTFTEGGGSSSTSFSTFTSPC